MLKGGRDCFGFPSSFMHFSSSTLYSKCLLKYFFSRPAWLTISLTGWRSYSFCGCIHFPPLFFFFILPCLSLPLLKIHSLFKHNRLLRASGNEVPAHLRCTDFSLQRLPHVGDWQLHVAPSICSSGQAREDKRMVSCTQQPLRVDPGEF